MSDTGGSVIGLSGPACTCERGLVTVIGSESSSEKKRTVGITGLFEKILQRNAMLVDNRVMPNS